MANGKKVLLVDDDTSLLNMYRLALKAADYEVEITQSGDEALAKVEQVKYDLVMVDVMMPVVDGITLIHRWPKTALTPKNKAVMMTSLTAESLKVKANELGVLGCWMKDDLTPEELVARVGKILHA